MLLTSVMCSVSNLKPCLSQTQREALSQALEKTEETEKKIKSKVSFANFIKLLIGIF